MPDYVDVTLYEEMDESAQVSISVDGKPAESLRVIRNEEVGDGFETTWRVQLR